jgi:hypothetical protein
MIRKFTDWRTWVRGLAAAIIGGGANAVTLMVVDPQQFNFDAGMPSLWKVTLVSALLNAAFYLKQSPIPSRETAEAEALQPEPPRENS